MYTKARKIPAFLIDSTPKPSGFDWFKKQHRNAYLAARLTFAFLPVASFAFALITLFPTHAGAFWPFSQRVDAASSATPLIHNPNISLLAAATNSDPDPVKVDEATTPTSGTALVADAGPTGTLADVASSTPSSDQISVYVVRDGDTLSKIATMFDVSVNTIVWANDLGSTKAIHTGQTLIILPVSGVQHTVVKGDTLKSIANKFGGDATEIAEYNGLDSGVALTVGTVVIIPGGELAVPAPTTSSHGGGSISHAPNEPYLGGSGPEIDGYFSNPVPGAILTQGIHGWNAVDLGAARGTTIYSAAPGVVIVAKANGAWNGGYGNYVVISDSNGTQTLYSHMSRVATSVGAVVSSGQIIGYVGATGMATGPHLHFEVRGAKNPFAFCPVGASCQPR